MTVTLIVRFVPSVDFQYFLALCLLCKLLKSFLSFFSVSNLMKKRVERLRYDVSFNPPGDDDFFYASAAKVLGIETQGLKKVIFDFLNCHKLDVNIQLIANSRTRKVTSLL